MIVSSYGKVTSHYSLPIVYVIQPTRDLMTTTAAAVTTIATATTSTTAAPFPIASSAVPDRIY